jgi:trans-2,3-dihydro-3-hydroxyanthranilate isomerase
VIKVDIDIGAGTDTHDYYVLDVFTDAPLAGNQLAVFTDGSPFDPVTMQRIARELALSETVFLLEPQHGGDARMRIFTPTIELPFAGHPTLGTAVLLGTACGKDQLQLETAGGVIPVTLERAGGAVVAGWMEQPIPTVELYEHGDELLAALGVGTAQCPIEAYTNGPVIACVVLDDEAAVAALRPDQSALTALGFACFSCVAGSGTSWKTRMFGPAFGVPEDPATGGAAGPLALHLARHALIDFGTEIEISQGAEIGRPSLLRARVDGSAAQVERVAVGGAAVIVARGSFRL